MARLSNLKSYLPIVTYFLCLLRLQLPPQTAYLLEISCPGTETYRRHFISTHCNSGRVFDMNELRLLVRKGRESIGRRVTKQPLLG